MRNMYLAKSSKGGGGVADSCRNETDIDRSSGIFISFNSLNPIYFDNKDSVEPLVLNVHSPCFSFTTHLDYWLRVAVLSLEHLRSLLLRRPAPPEIVSSSFSTQIPQHG